MHRCDGEPLGGPRSSPFRSCSAAGGRPAPIPWRGPSASKGMACPPQGVDMSEMWTILAKDLRIEWRSKTRVLGLASRSDPALALRVRGGPDRRMLAAHASAYVWIGVVSVSTLLLAQSFQQEIESDALEGLLLLPVKPASIFYGKAIANTLWMCILAIFSLQSPWFSLNSIPRALLGSRPLCCLAVLGMAAPGTLYAGLTARLASTAYVACTALSAGGAHRALGGKSNQPLLFRRSNGSSQFLDGCPCGTELPLLVSLRLPLLKVVDE